MPQPYIKSTITSLSDSGYKAIPEDDGFSILAVVYTSAGPLTKQKILSQTDFINKYLTGTRILPSDNISAKYVYKLLESNPVYVMRACSTNILEGLSCLGNEYLFNTDYKLLDEYYQSWVVDNKVIEDEDSCLVYNLYWDLTKYNFYNSDKIVYFNYGDTTIPVNINGVTCNLTADYSIADNITKITLSGYFKNLDLHGSNKGDTLSVSHIITVEPRTTIINDRVINNTSGDNITYDLSGYDWNQADRSLSNCSKSISFTMGDSSVDFYISGIKYTLDIVYKDNGDIILFGYFKNVELDKNFAYDILSVNHIIANEYYSLRIQQKNLSTNVSGDIYNFYVGSLQDKNNYIQISSELSLSDLMDNLRAYIEYRNVDSEGDKIGELNVFGIEEGTTGYNVLSTDPITLSSNLTADETTTKNISIIDSLAPTSNNNIINTNNYATIDGIKYIYNSTEEDSNIINIEKVGNSTSIFSSMFFLELMSKTSPEYYSGSIGVRIYDYVDEITNYNVDYIYKSDIKGLRIRNKSDVDFTVKDIYQVEEGEEQDTGKITLIENKKTTVDSDRGYEFIVAELANPFNKTTKEYKQVAFIWAKDSSITIDVTSFNTTYGTNIAGYLTIGTGTEFTASQFLSAFIRSICTNCYIENEGSKEYIYIPTWQDAVEKQSLHFDSARIMYLTSDSVSSDCLTSYSNTLYTYSNIRPVTASASGQSVSSSSSASSSLSSVGTLVSSAETTKYSVLNINKYVIYDYNINGYLTDENGSLMTYTTETEVNNKISSLNGSIDSVFTKKGTNAYTIGTVTTDLSSYTVTSLSSEAIGTLDAYNALSAYIQDDYSPIIKINEDGLYVAVLVNSVIFNNESEQYYKNKNSYSIKVFSSEESARTYITKIIETEQEESFIDNAYIQVEDHLYTIGDFTLSKSFNNITIVNISSAPMSYKDVNAWLINNIPYYHSDISIYKNKCTYIDNDMSISANIEFCKVTITQDPVEQFAVVQKFPTADAMFKFSYSTDEIIDDMIDITLDYKSGTVVFNETMSFTPGVVDGYGVDQWYTKVDNDYFKIVNLQETGAEGKKLDSYDSDSFGDDVGINPYSVDLMKDTVNSIYSYYGDGVDYTVISDSGISNSEYASTIQTIAKDINSCYPASLPAKTKSTTELIAFKNAAALTSPYVRLLVAGSRETVDGFSAVFPGSLHLIKSMLNLFRRQGCKFAPNFDINYGKVSVGQLIQKFTKSEKETLLSNKIEALKQNSDGTFYINDNITAQNVESSLSENQNMLMAISIIHLINNLLPVFKGRFNNIPLRNAIINNLSDNISSLLKGERDRVKVKLVCDETNNTINEINNRKLVVSLYLQFTPSVKFIFIKDFILSL